jgi:hypothetical protein
VAESEPQEAIAEFALNALRANPGTPPSVLVMDQFTVSPLPEASSPSVAVSVTAPAPAPRVVAEGELNTEMVMASTVNVIVEVTELLLAEVAVMVAVQFAFSVAADGGV